MLRHLVFGAGFLAATMLSSAALAEGGRTLQIIISKNKQSMTVYDGDQVVTTTKVSTGKNGHTTPSGIFSILQKEKYHESNLYSNAPMPWMQRLTWSGIALHEGHVPNYPASHGCIRMPAAFAKSLYQMTERGAHVLISEAPVVPVKAESANFFHPRRPLPAGPLLSDVELRTSAIDMSKKSEVAMNIAPNKPTLANPAAPPASQPATAVAKDDTPPLRILITRRGDRETLMDAQVLLQDMGFDTGGADGFAGPMTRSAINGFKRWKNLPEKGALMTPEFLTKLYEAAGKPKPPAGQIMVRRNFEPLFEAPVGIKTPDIALGTHFFTADRVERGSETATWTTVTLPNELTDATKRRLGITLDNDPLAPNAAASAFERIEIPAEIRDRIEGLLNDGTSVTINDQGLGTDTGDGTDFITITKPMEQVAEADIASQSERAVTKPRPVRQTRSERRQGFIGLY